MTLSLEAIYQPISEFFTRKFGGGEGEPVTFRFADLAPVFTDADLGPQQVIADEQFSAIVNRVPFLKADERTVSLESTYALSNIYHDEMLAPAMPFVPNDVVDEAERQARIDAFNAVKADALRIWEAIKVASLLEGPGVQFRPSMARPKNWWDVTGNAWIHQSFQVQGTVAVPRQQPPNDKLLRMKVEDSVLRSILESQVVEPAPAQFEMKLSQNTVQMMRPACIAVLAADDAHVRIAGEAPVMRQEANVDGPLLAADRHDVVFGANAAHVRIDDAVPAVRQAVGADRPLMTLAMQDDLNMRIAPLPFKQRYEIAELLFKNAQVQHITTNDVTISFEYCVVNVTRPWLHNAFINNQSWRIPGLGKGQLTAGEGRGLRALTIGFVAIKNLRIKAPWTAEDITNLELSAQFGPFNINSKIIDGAVGYDPIQIVGWMLQQLPDLPPISAQ